MAVERNTIVTLHNRNPLHTFFAYFFVIFYSCYSYERVCEKRLLHEFPISIAMLNGTFFFRSVKAINNWKRSTVKQILLN